MADHYASGNWLVGPGKEDEFIRRWTEFLEWTKASQPSLVTARLIRDEQDPRHFLSVAEWKDAAGRNAWKQSPEFSQKFGACRELCEEFSGGDFSHASSVGNQPD